MSQVTRKMLRSEVIAQKCHANPTATNSRTPNSASGTNIFAPRCRAETSQDHAQPEQRLTRPAAQA